jgi:hypothetical protein
MDGELRGIEHPSILGVFSCVLLFREWMFSSPEFRRVHRIQEKAALLVVLGFKSQERKRLSLLSGIRSLKRRRSSGAKIRSFLVDLTV